VKREPWRPAATHWHLPVPVQAIRYTGGNAEEVLAWARTRGASARVARYTNWQREHPPLLVDCHWQRSGIHAEGALEAGDWLVMTFGPHCHVQGWSGDVFTATYTDAAPPEPPKRKWPRR
jgi:hypothetical protein